MGEPWVIGTAVTDFARQPDRTLLELATAAGSAALADAEVEPAEVGALYVGSFLAQRLERQGLLAAHLAARLGMTGAAASTVEGACASGHVALREGAIACRAGVADVALCVGAERMTTHEVPEVTSALAEAADATVDRAAGLTFPGFFGLVASAHQRYHGTTRAQLSSVVVQARRHGASNVHALFRTPIVAGDVAASRPIADPLRLFDCSAIADGAAAAVVATGPRARRSPRPGVRVRASEQASGPPAIAEMRDLTYFPATRVAAARAYAAAGVGPADIDVVELHDCFSIAAIVDAEDLGLFAPGEAATAIAEGETAVRGGGVAVNPSGGLLARGHPVGATGLAQIHELVEQLRGTSTNQADSPQLALAHTLGGSGGIAVVSVLERP